LQSSLCWLTLKGASVVELLMRVSDPRPSFQQSSLPPPVVSSPAVTVVMAAYNRGNIIRHAIDSVLRQTLTDWELLVMGDACTDDTGDVVTSVADPRVTFINLPENSGDQATPNNAGCARARGRYIAFLNQDDFWLPDHLSRSVAALDAVGPGGAEMEFGLLIQITAPGHWYV